MSMDTHLAEIYGTPGLEQDENLTKAAEAELFVKLAQEQGIDLDTLSDDQIEELYNTTFSKTASEEEDKEEKKEEEDKKEDKKLPPMMMKDEEKEAAAQAEFLEKKAQQEKWAEADRMGRIMAHAYVQELGLIGQNIEKQASAQTEQPKEASAPAAAPGSESSAIDDLAVPAAIEKVASAGWNREEATARVQAVATLGLAESEKTASAQSVEEAVDTRALEYLEAAGYPVTWQE